MKNTPAEALDASTIKWLKVLVMTLTITLIVGFVVIVGLFVLRFNSLGPQSLTLPETIALPDGSVAQSFTVTSNWYAVVTENDAILIFDRSTGILLNRITVVAEP